MSKTRGTSIGLGEGLLDGKDLSRRVQTGHKKLCKSRKQREGRVQIVELFNRNFLSERRIADRTEKWKSERKSLEPTSKLREKNRTK